MPSSFLVCTDTVSHTQLNVFKRLPSFLQPVRYLQHWGQRAGNAGDLVSCDCLSVPTQTWCENISPARENRLVTATEWTQVSFRPGRTTQPLARVKSMGIEGVPLIKRGIVAKRGRGGGGGRVTKYKGVMRQAGADVAESTE